METDLQRRFDQLVNGTGSRYEIILNAIRENLQSENLSLHGCIAFYNYDIENTGNMLMKVFPFNPNIIQSNFPDELKIQVAALERINADRPYDKMHHLKIFRKHYSGMEHYNLHIPKKEIVKHNKNEVNGKGWLEFVKDVNIEDNILDLLFYKSEDQHFHVIPLPLLSSPCMLLFQPACQHDFNEIYTKVKESIDFYLYNRLLIEISKDIKPGQINDKKELIRRFLREFSQVAIPIKYEFDGQDFKCFDWYGRWNTDNAAIFELYFSDESAKIFMPTFCCHSGVMIHTLPEYYVKLRQVKETIQNIFSLVYNYWQTINSKKLLVQSEISPLISELRESVAGMKAMKMQVEDKISEQTQKVETLSKLVVELGGDTSQPIENEFYFLEKSDAKKGKVWNIRFKDVQIVTGEDDIAYEYLQTIIANPNLEISVSAFGANGLGDEGETRSASLVNTKKDYQDRLTKIEMGQKLSEMSLNDCKNYVTLLAGYINAARDLRDSYTDALGKFNAILKLIKSKNWMDENEYKDYEKKMIDIAKQTRQSTLSRKEEQAITQPLRALIKKLKKKENGTLEPLLNCIKVGKVSIFRPTRDLNIFWKLTSDFRDC